MRSLLPFLGRLAFPAAILIAAFVLVYVSGTIPSSLDWLRLYGPYFMFAIGAALAAIFNRGRSLFALITLVTAYVAHQWWLQEGLTTPSARAVYLALTVFVPVNLGFAALLSERGVSNRHSVLYFAILAVEIAVAAWVIAYGRTDISEWGLRKFVVPAPFAIGAIPQTGIVALLLALVVSMAAAFASRSAVSASCAGAIVAFAVAAHVPTASLTFSIFIAAAELMIVIAILQDRFSTTLPGRARTKARTRSAR
jgi:hypothetical protein